VVFYCIGKYLGLSICNFVMIIKKLGLFYLGGGGGIVLYLSRGQQDGSSPLTVNLNLMLKDSH
jgi:hypothetical protein